MSSQAEHQANVRFSYKKYYGFRNKVFTKFSEKFYSDMQIGTVSQALLYGDTQPALVVSADPLLIAAYSDEMDAVVMLRFPALFADTYHLTPGTRLTSSCVYRRGETVAVDIIPGSAWSGQFADFTPIVQLILGKNDDKIRAKAELFSESVWERVSAAATEYGNTSKPERDGLFFFRK